ncbi:MAG: NRDE family protein, partial [Betaproteobacteria bacterium]
MCLILIAHRADPRYRLVIAANRDEFLRRPTAAAGYWPDARHVLGGRDLEKGGGWLAITTDGRWAAVTNFRDGKVPEPGARSRGDLVAEYVRSSVPAQSYMQSLYPLIHEFHGFNLLTGDATGVHFLSNRDDAAVDLAPALYGLSNHHLDTPWPKVERGKLALRAALARN